jgi:hypothetical protein
MSEFHLPHAIFDPASRYNRFRRVCDPHEKLLGYFDWLAHKKKQQADLPAPWLETSPDLAARAGPLVIRLDNVAKPVAAEVEVPEGGVLGGSYEVFFRLQKMEDRPASETPCRVLLLEPDTLGLLRENLASEGRQLPRNEEKAIRMLLSEDCLETSLEAARVLAALPELEGSTDKDGEGSARAEIPFGCPNAPPGTWIVVVYDPPPGRQAE